MLRKVLKLPCIAVMLLLFLTSCESYRTLTLKVDRVAYQSVRPEKYSKDIPDNARVVVYYSINTEGYVFVEVENRTDEIMIVDKSKSFFVSTNGTSHPYFGSTIQTTAKTDLSTSTKGLSVNVGPLNIGGYNTVGSSRSDVTTVVEQSQMSIAPHSSMEMPKKFLVDKLGRFYLNVATNTFIESEPSESPCRFSVCVSFSLDGGVTFEKIITDFYVNSQIIEPVNAYGGINDAIRRIAVKKPDAFNELFYLLYVPNNIETYRGESACDAMINGERMYNYK